MSNKIRFASAVLATVMSYVVVLPSARAQNTEPGKFFREYLGLNDDQIASIRKGKAIAKILESRTPDEVFVKINRLVRTGRC